MKYRKTKISLVVIATLLIISGYWILEPFYVNPLKEAPVSLSESEGDLKSYNCNQTLINKADSIVNNAILLNDFIGLSAAIYSEDCGLWMTTAGYANKGKQVKPKNNTQFRIASISKPMTAVAIMQLYERKLIDLDVAIQEYLPEFPVSSKGDITIRQLLNHTSGIQHYSSMWDGTSFTQYESAVEAIDEFKNRELSFVPGTAYLYTTYGYTILGAIIEKVTHQSYQDYMKKNIFVPTNMMNTAIEESHIDYENKANLYIKWNSRFIKSPKTNLSVKAPGGGIISTAEDLVKFGEAILNNTLIDSITLDLMMNIQHEFKEGTPYGFGWFVRNDNKYGRILEHGGSQSGASSFFRIYLDEQLVTAVIANNFNSDNEVYFLSRDLTELLLDSTRMNRSVNYFSAQVDAVLERYIGTYDFEGQILSISKAGNQLYAQTHPYPKVPIYSQSEDAFFYRIFDGRLKFNSENGEVVSVKFIGSDGVKLYERG